MQVSLKNNMFTATQWFKDGDHPAVKYYKVGGLEEYQIWTVCDIGEEDPSVIVPGIWIVEMFDGIHLYSDKDFREMFEEARRKSYTEFGSPCSLCDGTCTIFSCGAEHFCDGDPVKMKQFNDSIGKK